MRIQTLCLSIIVVLSALLPHTRAATFTDCSSATDIRTAIIAGGDVIFNCGAPTTVYLAPLALIADTNIVGNELITFTSTPVNNTFTFIAMLGINATFSGVTIRTTSTSAGGILDSQGATNVNFINCNLISGAGTTTALISLGQSAGTSLRIDRSFISAGGFFATSLISVTVQSTVSITSSTLAGTNNAGNGIQWTANAGSLSIAHSTVAFCTLNVVDVSNTGVTVNFVSSILGGGTSGDKFELPATGVTSGGYNIAINGPIPNLPAPAQASDQKIDPLISAQPVNVGAFTQVHTLQPCSPAVNTGNLATTLTTDQINGARVAQQYPDVGAFESNHVPCISIIGTTVTSTAGPQTIELHAIFSSNFIPYTVTVESGTLDGNGTITQVYDNSGGTLIFPGTTTTNSLATYALVKGTNIWKPTLTFYVTLTKVSGGPINITTPTALMIVQNGVPTPSLTISLGSASQLLEGGVVMFKPALQAASYYDTLVSITYEGTAVDGFNYISVPTMTIPAQSIAGVNYNVQTKQNFVCEGPKTLIAKLVTAPPNTQLGTPTSATVTIRDNDKCHLTLPTSTNSFNENAGLVTVPVVLDYPVAVNNTFNVSVIGPSNIFTLLTPLVTVVANTTTASILLNITQDFIYQGPVYLNLTIFNIVGSGLLLSGTNLTQNITINNVDVVPYASIVTTGVPINENSTAPLNLSVVLSSQTVETVTIPLVFSGRGITYGNIATGTLPPQVVFQPYQTEAVISIPVHQNWKCGPTNLVLSFGTGVINAQIGTPATVDSAISDVDECYLFLLEDTLLVPEGSGLHSLPFATDFPSIDDAYFSYYTVNDYTNLIVPINDNFTVLLPAGQTTGNIVVNVTRDYLYVASSPTTIRVELVLVGSTLKRGNLTSEDINVENKDPIPVLAIQPSFSVDEDAGFVTVALTLSNPAAFNVHAKIEYFGAYNWTDNIVDNTTLLRYIEIPSPQTSISFNFTTFRNYVCGSQYLNIYVDDPSSEVLLGNSWCNITLTDVDTCGVSFPPQTITVQEGSGSLSIPVILDYPSNRDLSFCYNVTGLSDIYTKISTNPIVIASYVKTSEIDLNIIRDSVYRAGDGSLITVTLYDCSDLNTPVAPGQVVNITDNDLPPIVSLQAPPSIYENSQTALTLMLTLVGTSAVPVQVLLDYTGDNNITTNLVVGSLASLPQQAQFPPFQNIITVDISVHQNHICGPQNLSVELGATPSVRVSSTANQATTTILDIDICAPLFPPQVIVVGEGSGSLTIPVNVGNPSTETITVCFNVTGPSNLYNLITSSPITLPPIVQTSSISLDIIRDSIFFGGADSQLSVTLYNCSVSDLSDPSNSHQIVNITDNDLPPIVSLHAPASILENSDSPIPLRLDLVGTSVVPVQVKLNYNGGSNIDTNLALGSLAALPQQAHFAPFQNTVYVNISVHQNFFCGAQNLTVALGATISARISATDNQATTTILDIDTCSVSFPPQTIVVGEGSGKVTIPVDVEFPSDKPITFCFDVTGPSDLYTAITNPITIPAGATASSIDLNIIRDNIYRGGADSQLFVVLTNCSVEATGPRQVINITDNDLPPVVSLQAPAYIYENSQDPLSLVLTLDGTSSVPVQVLLSYVGGTNISSNLVAGSLSALPAQVQFNPYQNIVYVNVSVHQNHICGPQDLNAALGATSSVRVSTSASKTTTTILDVDTCSVYFPPQVITIGEGSGQLTIPVDVDHPSSGNIQFCYIVTGSSDLYTVISSNPVTIAPYQQTASIILNIIRDNVYRGGANSQISVTVYNCSSPSSGNITQVVAITDNDLPPIVSLQAPLQIIETSTTPLTLTLTLDGTSAVPVQVLLNYASASYNISSNLLAGSLAALLQQVEFAPNQNLVIVDIFVTPNHVCGSQSFSVSLGATSSGRVSNSANNATIGIVDAEVCCVSFSKDTVDTVEGAGQIYLAYELTNPSATPSQFSFNFSGAPNLVGLPQGGSYTVSLNAFEKAGIFPVSVGSDNIHQVVNPLTVVATLYGFTAPLTGCNVQENIRVTDTTPAPYISLTSSTKQILEISSLPIIVTLILTATTAAPVNVSLIYSGGGTANLNNPPPTVNFEPYQTQVTFPIPVQQNNLCGDQNITISINRDVVLNGGIIVNQTQYSALVLIADASVCSASLVCGNASIGTDGTAVFPVAINTASTLISSVGFEVSTSVGNGDPLVYSVTSTNPIIFPALSRGSAITLKVTPTNIYQPVRNLSISLQNPNNIQLGAKPTCQLSIPPVGSPPALFFDGSSVGSSYTITVLANTSNSGGATFSFNVNLTTATYQSVTFTIQFSGPGAAYLSGPNSSLQITIPPHQQSTVIQITVSTNVPTTSSLYIDITNTTNAALAPSGTRITVVISAGTIPTLAPPIIVDTNSNETLTAGAIAGIVIGAFVALLCLIFLLFFVLCYKRDEKQQQQQQQIPQSLSIELQAVQTDEEGEDDPSDVQQQQQLQQQQQSV